TCSWNVTVNDVDLPIPSCIDKTVWLNSLGTVSITGQELDGSSSDNCGVPGTLIFSAEPDEFTCNDLGSNEVILTVTDGSGNTATCFSTVTVWDTVRPAAICRNSTIFLNSSGTVSLSSNQLNNGSFDNCVGPLTFTVSTTSFTCSSMSTAGGGNAFASAKDFNPFDLRRSVGMGLRVFLPMFGTLGFDYGIGIDKPELYPSRKLGSYAKFNIVLGFEPD
ncbi:MAG: hypothetical protein ACKOCH_04685, partial [Bacteroidota bacterium]